MGALITEQVTEVRHWNDTLFSFKTTRDDSFRFKNGYFTMIGLQQEAGLCCVPTVLSVPITRRIGVLLYQGSRCPLTSQLQNIQPGDEVLVGKKATGTLVTDNLLPGRNLYLLSTGTGLAPFLSIIKDHEIYDHFDKIILTHGVRYVSELAYQDYIEKELPHNEYFGDLIQKNYCTTRP